MYKEFLGGLGYVLQMYMGNDVLYFEKQDQINVYKVVKEGVSHFLKSSPQALRMAPYSRLLIEPLFAYNHFEENEQALELDSFDVDEEEYSGDDGSQGEDHDDDLDGYKKTQASEQAEKKKKLVISGEGFKI